jgi:hypothetical protein
MLSLKIVCGDEEERVLNRFCRAFYMMFFCLILATGQTVSGSELLIIRAHGAGFDDVEKGIREECGNDFEVHDFIMGDSTAGTDIARAVGTVLPDIVVLMDDRAITLFREYQKTLTDSESIIPSVSIMGVLVEEVMTGLKNAHGISYEVPIVTAARELQSVLGRPIVKIGVVHREKMSDYFRKNTGYAQKENFEIIPCLVSGSGVQLKDELKKGLLSLVRDKAVDALLVPNDNALLKPELITDVWLPMENKFKKPVIVGVEVLAEPEINLGTLAIVPDHFALGKQAAGLLFNARDNHWRFGETRVDPPVSVYKILNGTQAKCYFHLGKGSFRSVDKVLERKNRFPSRGFRSNNRQKQPVCSMETAILP